MISQERNAAKATWAAAPRYLLRRALILERLKEINPPSILEIGCGAGDLLGQLAHRGYQVHGIEISEIAFALLHQQFAGSNNPTVELGDFNQLTNTFDAVLAFEVLEHIDDDAAALRKWRDLITPGGHLVISVPAHTRQWTLQDKAAGHFRRYERRELWSLLRRSGLSAITIDCYGFPLANLVAPLSTMASRPWLRYSTMAARTKNSGVSRTLAQQLRWLCNPVTIWPWAQIQRFFLRTELGNGYLVVARRVGD